MVPLDAGDDWPTLGGLVCDFLEERAVHGPGDLKGRPYRLDDEKRALIHRFYEVYPRGHQMAGRRRFKQCDISVRKGTAKTELAAAVAFVELHPEGPVRCDGWHRVGRSWLPVGRPVVDPYVPMVAYTEEQTEELAYAALYTMITEGPDAGLFDAGLDRILRLDERGRADGRAVALASSPDARDGARTTFQHFDETHRMTLPRQVATHETMLQNIPKRMGADAWSLGTTTTYTPGEGSVAEAVHEQAELIARGEVEDATVFFFHREADAKHKIEDPDGLRLAIRDASGPAVASWDHFDAQVESIASLYQQAKRRGKAAYFERVWLNRRVQSDRKAFDYDRWVSLGKGRIPPDGAMVTAGFDGSRWRDGTGLVVTDVRTSTQWKYALWTVDEQHPEIPTGEVDEVVDELFGRFNVLRFYGDPAAGWDKAMNVWSERHGPKRVVEFHTDSRGFRKIGMACRNFNSALVGGDLRQVEDDDFSWHIGNACKRDLNVLDEDRMPLWTIEKERRDSPLLMDLAMCAVLSWEAAMDALRAGEAVEEQPKDTRVTVFT
jgi:hypothetical protein